MKGNTGKKGGAKIKYTDDFPLFAEQYARDGLNDVEIAKKLGICLQTYYQYQKEYPKFLEAIRRGKGPVDAKVVNSFLKRAYGYTYTERKFIKITTPQEIEKAKKSGLEVKGTVLRVEETVKEVVPDTLAAWKWMCNRMPDKYREKQEISIPDGIVLQVTSDFMPQVKAEGKDE